MELDPVFLSRLQFAFVISFHIIFPSFTIGLAAWLATIEGVRLTTGKEISLIVLGDLSFPASACVRWPACSSACAGVTTACRSS